MCLSEQQSAEDVKKLAFMMFPSHSHGCLTAIELAKLIEREGGLNRGVGAGGQGGQSPPYFSSRGGSAPPLLYSSFLYLILIVQKASNV